MSGRRSFYISHPSSLEHEMGPGHPEQPARVSAIQDRLITAGVFDFLHQPKALPATQAQLAHDTLYLDELAAAAPSEEGRLVRVDPDTAINRHTLDAAAHAAGAVIQAVDLVLGGEAGAAFCNTRPGHHAERGRAMGSCFYNNVAIGALHALSSMASSGRRSSISTSITATAPPTSSPATYASCCALPISTRYIRSASPWQKQQTSATSCSGPEMAGRFSAKPSRPPGSRRWSVSLRS